MNFEQCADDSIGEFAATLGVSYYPQWYGLVPRDSTSGWGASEEDWLAQAGGIIGAFERCSGVHVGVDEGEIGKLGNMTLADFSEYLVEKAEESAAQLGVRMATNHLDAVRELHADTGVRARLAERS